MWKFGSTNKTGNRNRNRIMNRAKFYAVDSEANSVPVLNAENFDESIRLKYVFVWLWKTVRVMPGTWPEHCLMIFYGLIYVVEFRHCNILVFYRFVTKICLFGYCPRAHHRARMIGHCVDIMFYSLKRNALSWKLFRALQNCMVNNFSKAPTLLTPYSFLKKCWYFVHYSRRIT